MYRFVWNFHLFSFHSVTLDLQYLEFKKQFFGAKYVLSFVDKLYAVRFKATYIDMEVLLISLNVYLFSSDSFVVIGK